MHLAELDTNIRRAVLDALVFPSILTGTVGAFVVDSSAFDPATLVQRTPPRDWFCLKWGGRDTGSQESYKKTFHYLRGGGHHVGTWVFCSDFAPDDTGALLAAAIMTWPRQPDFVVYDPENNYKRNGDAGDGFWRAAALVEAHNHLLAGVPAGVLLPGKADTEMDLSTFLLAGWP